ncbi:dihydrolipoamide succinyltransferase component of 2-oxoglutarate dehydrogenase complex [Thioploca ingrica]|uniref:Dihydrolipoyllysine-residue succinyltransferase component of 2-oxoglutarate dehydrogenase complex n=1 Tax=Thioploca ingrica TaxID=40754 RepID=A0A090BW00_9GAMM|nr:dihydrolipoamide succinyltransferase component of 2-oxoglutarate dehydrogenase complex [Thioploca ingrica]
MSIFEVKVPVLAESVAEATLLTWYFQPGDAIKENDKLVEIETDKVVLEVVTPHTGVLKEILKPGGENVFSGEVIGYIDTSGAPLTTPPPHLESATTTSPPVIPVKTSPAVRKIAAEQGIEPWAVPHQGDRVTKADLLRQSPQPWSIQEKPSSPIIAEPTRTSPALRGTTADTLGRPEERVPMTRLRKRVAERLLAAQHHHAILTTFNEINMQAVMDLRQKHREAFEKKHNVKLGFMSFFTKAVVMALQRFPIINASTEGDDIIYHGYYDIGIAVNSSRGLVVPILRDVDILSFAEIEKNIANFAQRARDAQLSIEELNGGTFSITNGGVFGSMLSTPILNPPQSAILGMHNIVERPIAENGQVVIRPIMYVALSYDHRLIDGRDAIQFLMAIKNAIEDPARLLLDI